MADSEEKAPPNTKVIPPQEAEGDKVEVDPEELKVLEAEEGKQRRDSHGRSSVGSVERLKGFFTSPPQGSVRAIFASQWVVDLERQQEGYTASRARTICSMLTGSFAVTAQLVLYVCVFCFILLTDTDEEGAIGFGDDVMAALVDSGASVQDVSVAQLQTSTIIGGITIFLWSFIYIFDVYNWNHTGKVAGLIGKFLMLVGIALCFVTSLLLTSQFASFPFLTFWVFSLGSLVLIKTYIFPTVQKLYFLRSLQLTLFFWGLVMLIVYCISVFSFGKYFSGRNQVVYHNVLECPPLEDNGVVITFEALLNDNVALDAFIAANNFPDCDEAFLVWAAPGLYFMVAWLLAGVMFFLYRAEKRRIESKQAVGVEPMAQVFLSAMLLSLLGLWVSASIASATAAVGDAILTMSFASLIFMFAIAIAVFGTTYLDSQVKKTSIGKKAYELAGSDWGKGLVLVTLTPMLVLFLVVDYVKQKIRTKTCLGIKIEDEAEKNAKFTKPVNKQLQKAYKWEWGSVITKALVWGMIFFLLSVMVSRFTLVFLSFLREQLQDLTLVQASFVLTGVGLLMFLLPPIPGVPVYVTAGVILPGIAGNEGFSLALAILYATVLGLILKLLALIMQQKLIGEMCGSRSVSVRYAVGINSVELRAMKKVLEKPGFNWKKVAILCGGPDWPTSVLTGILKLSVWPMLLGTVPVVFLIAPCVLSGAMIVESSANPEKTLFTSLNTIALFFTVVVQAAAMLGAAQVLASAAVTYEKELENEPKDQQVLELEEKNREKNENYKIVTAWRNLNGIWKFLHIVALTLMILSCYAFQFFGTTLFITFEITDDIGIDLGGNALHLITNPGWIAVSMFLYSMTYYFVFKRVHKSKRPTEEMRAASQAEAKELNAELGVGDKEKKGKTDPMEDKI